MSILIIEAMRLSTAWSASTGGCDNVKDIELVTCTMEYLFTKHEPNGKCNQTDSTNKGTRHEEMIIFLIIM